MPPPRHDTTLGPEEADAAPRLGLPAIDQQRVRAALFEGAAPEPEPRALGRFRVRRRLGRGGMGTVLEAHDPKLDRTVALKVLHHRADPHHEQRLLREAQALARLSHPNVVQVFEAGEVDGHLFIAMELVRGRTLWSWHQGPHPWRECLEVYLQAGRGLAAAHAVGTVHRDFKPANCIIDDEGRVKVLDFGLARGHTDRGAEAARSELRSRATTLRDAHSGSEGSDGATDSTPGPRLTRTGTRLGTPAYMAPEQAELGPVDARADQYSFCVALYEALLGTHPFDDEIASSRDGDGTMRPSFSPAPSHAPLPRAPTWLRRVVARGLEHRRDDRYPSMEALLDAIERHLRARRRWRGALGAGLGIAVTVVTTRTLLPPEASGPRCEIDASALAGTWDAARRDAVREALLGQELDFGDATHRAIDTRLERWATSWVESRRGACVATHVEGVASEALLDRRIDCLDRQQRAAAALVDAFTTADAATLAHGPELLAELPEPTWCEQPPTSSDAGGLPRDPVARAAVLDGYEQVARARAELRAGALVDASARIQVVEELGRDRSYLALELEARVLRGELAGARGRYEEAAEHLVGAIHGAASEGLAAIELEARRRAVDALVGTWSKPEAEALLIDELVAAATRGGASSGPAHTAALAARARLALVAGEPAQALAHVDELRQSQDGRADLRLWLDQAAALSHLARHDEARTVLREGLALARDRWGEGSPVAAKLEQDLGMLALETGAVDEARRLLALAREHLEAATGVGGVPAARARFCQAKLAMATGAFESAQLELEHVGEVFLRDLGPTHEETGQLFNAMGVARFYEGDFLGSITAYERSLVAGLAVYGPAHAEVGLVRSNLAESRAALGDHARALDEYGAALAVMSVALPPAHPSLASAYKGRGKSLLATGRADEARLDLERALELLLRPPSEPFELADTRAALAATLVETQQEPERARELAELAAQGFDALGLRERADEARGLLSTTPPDTRTTRRPP